MQPAYDQEVNVTLLAYGRCLDTPGSEEEFIDLFTHDAVFTLRGRTYNGRDGVRSFLAQRQNSGPVKHMLSLSVLTYQRDGTCAATGETVPFRPDAEGNIKIVFVGRFDDRLRRDDDRWRFTHKTVEPAAGFGLER